MVRTRMKAEVICRAQRNLIKALFEFCGVFLAHYACIVSFFSASYMSIFICKILLTRFDEMQ